MPNINPITINGYSLDSSASVMATNTTHDSAPNTDLSLIKISRRDGAKMTNAQYAEKSINITGAILLNDVNSFEQTADDFKRNVEVVNGALQIPYANGTRQYNVNTVNAMIMRDSDNIDWAPYSLEFIAADPPFGTDIVTQTFYSASNITTNPWSASVYFGGSAEPKPTISIGVSSGSFLTALQFQTFSPATTIQFSDSQFSTGNNYNFNTNTFQLQRNGQAMDYSGLWPRFTPNQWNGVTLTTTGTTGYTIDQQQLVSTNAVNWTGAVDSFEYTAQTFIPSVTASVVQVDLMLKSAGPVGGGDGNNDVPITVTINTTSGGLPTQTVLATATIPVEAVTPALTLVTAVFGSPVSLTGGTTYAIVFNSIYSPTTNVVIYGAPNNQYANGQAYFSDTHRSGSFAWLVIPGDDLFFREWNTQGTTATNLNISFTGQNRWL